MFIKLLEDYEKGLYGIKGATIGRIYTANEFIEVFGIGVYDVIRDEFCDSCEGERKKTELRFGIADYVFWLGMKVKENKR